MEKLLALQHSAWANYSTPGLVLCSGSLGPGGKTGATRPPLVNTICLVIVVVRMSGAKYGKIVGPLWPFRPL